MILARIELIIQTTVQLLVVDFLLAILVWILPTIRLVVGVLTITLV